MTDLTQRYMSAVAAVGCWDDEDYDIENVDEWEPMDGGTYETGRLTPSRLRASGDGTVAGWLIEEDTFTNRTMEVFYNSSAVHLTFEGKSEELRAGGLAELTTDQARDLAAALFQAAEELDQRREANNAD